MKIYIIAVGNRMPGWVDTAYQEYVKRFSPECRVHLRAIPSAKRTRHADIPRLLRDEGARLLAAVPTDCQIVALDRTGRQMNTEQLADKLRSWLGQGDNVAFLIGGPEGLAQECVQQSHALWSLSSLTLAHPLVRVVLIEQLYRAWSIIKGLPYHR